MAVAMIYPESEKRGRGNKSSVSDEFERASVSATRVKMARMILRYLPHMAQQVLTKGTTLDGRARDG
jgi:hypothetical protein